MHKDAANLKQPLSPLPAALLTPAWLRTAVGGRGRPFDRLDSMFRGLSRDLPADGATLAALNFIQRPLHFLEIPPVFAHSRSSPDQAFGRIFHSIVAPLSSARTTVW